MALAARRLAGLFVVVLSVVPLFRLLRLDRSGSWGEGTVAEATQGYDLVLWGSILSLGFAAVVGIWAKQRARSAPDEAPFLDRLRPMVGWIASIPAVPFATVCGGLSFWLAALVATRVFRRLLTNVDEITSTIHARYLAAGQLGGPVGDTAEAWLIPNMLVTDVGWVSQYPPGHLLFLAAAEFAGAPWLMGPLLCGLMVAFSCLSAVRLLPTRPAEARIGGLLLALSPFVLLMGGGALSHLSAGAAISASFYFALRARDGRAQWALAAGATTGLAVVSRPWTGLTLGAVLVLGPWLHQTLLARRASEREKGEAALIPRLAGWIAGGVPFAVLIAAYNLQVFGNPLELGYEVLYGPAHKLGFHLDPWGFPYGLREAVAYTSADLVRFGLSLLETPVPLTIVAGVMLLVAPRLPTGTRTLALWALIPLLANALYWFHQPRMLYEATPAWILLGVIGLGAALRVANGAVRTAVAAGIVASVLVGVSTFVPMRFASITLSEETLARITPPELRSSDQPALVFVHASWSERVAGRFQASGMRNDSLQSLIRRNDMCALDRFARVRRGGDPDGFGSPLDQSIDLTPTSVVRAGLSRVATPGGVSVPRFEGAQWTSTCEREFRADRFGAVALAPLLWQGALPGLNDEGNHRERQQMFVRDFGPAANQSLLERFADREAWVFMRVDSDGPPRLLPYREGMQLLWEEALP